jgi:magnesium transporter
MRRVLGNMRDVTGWLQRTQNPLVAPDMWPFLRDVYDHTVRDLDLLETQRDLLNGALDIYLSSIANRTNRVMKVLTVLGTAALPALIISGMYGMNLHWLPWANSPHAFRVVVVLISILTTALLVLLKLLRWL